MLNRNLPLLLLLGFLLPTAAAQQASTGTPSATPAPTQLQTQSPNPSQPPAPAPPTATPIAKPQTPEEFFARARQLSDLEAAGIPFHLKATYVASGNTEFTGNGTYEEWWISPTTWRKEATLGAFDYLVSVHDMKSSVYATSSYVPLRLRQTMSNILIRTPGKLASAADWQLAEKKFSGITLPVVIGKFDCLNLQSQMYQLKTPYSPTSCQFDNYFTSDGLLRVRQAGTLQTIYNDWQPFQNHYIARNIEVAEGPSPILQILIDLLESVPDDTGTLSRINAGPKDSQAKKLSRGWVRAQGKALSDRMTYSPAPVYPLVARQKHAQGTVAVSVAIDDEGKIREPYIVGSSGYSLLDNAALDAIRKWRYSPLIVNGEPVVVQTVIRVVFTINR